MEGGEKIEDPKRDEEKERQDRAAASCLMSGFKTCFMTEEPCRILMNTFRSALTSSKPMQEILGADLHRVYVCVELIFL